ncbi:unnamed protein product [Merluccius merluccius]
MDTAKGEDGSAEQAASLFGATAMESNSGHHGHKWRSSNNWKFITVVLLLCVLVAILAIVLSMRPRCDSKGAIQNQDFLLATQHTSHLQIISKILSSCRNRCAAASRDETASCHCEPTCEAEGTCCLDYEEICLAPTFNVNMGLGLARNVLEREKQGAATSGLLSAANKHHGKNTRLPFKEQAVVSVGS